MDGIVKNDNKTMMCILCANDFNDPCFSHEEGDFLVFNCFHQQIIDFVKVIESIIC
jgi:hypothetical protein